jgi:DNA-binding LacI/PurR family transcriptional regulator
MIPTGQQLYCAGPGNPLSQMGSGKTTSFDIAHKAGVSQATVSRALRNSPLVNPETRKRIQKIAREMNYRVDRSAAGLRSQQSRTLALLLFEDPTSDDSQINPFFLTMLGNITRAAARNEYDVLVSFQQLSEDWLNEYQVSNRADGIILLGYGDYGSIAERLARLREQGAHFMIWGATMPELEGHAIGSENEDGGAMAAQHLIDQGRRQLVFLGGATDDCPEFKQRFLGACRAMREAGLETGPGIQFPAVNQETSGMEALDRLLQSGRPFDGIVAASDLIAMGAMKRLRKKGVRIPQDVSIVGFDDIPAASYFSPSLTTVRQDTRLAAETLVGNLLKMIEGETVESSLLPMTLVVRGSCGGRSDTS